MIMRRRLVTGLIALAAFLPLTFLAGHAPAQQASAAAEPRIDGFDVEPLKQLSSGNELAFTLYGSPGGIASVVIGGSTKTLSLAEVEAGVYEGSYTISSRDRITKESTATANLRVGNRVASSVLDESMVAGSAARWPGGAATASTPPRIDRFELDPPSKLVPGAELLFTLAGSPGGSASVRINGVKGKIALEEIRPGDYEGYYTVRNRDKLAVNTVVTGNLRLGDQERSMVLGQALIENAPSRPSGSGRRAAAPAPAPVCANCGVVEAINVVEVKGNGSYIGMIGGGLAGALLGSQIGSGSTSSVATVAGAAGGAWAGNEVEKRIKTTKHYEVVVRLANGGSQTVSYKAQPAFVIGSRVRVENGTLVQI